MMIYTAHAYLGARPEMVIVAEDPHTAKLIAKKVGKKKYHIENLGVSTYRVTKRACYRVR